MRIKSFIVLLALLVANTAFASDAIFVNSGMNINVNQIAAEGKVTIDVTDPEALLVRKNGDGGDVFIVNTTNEEINIDATVDHDHTFTDPAAGSHSGLESDVYVTLTGDANSTLVRNLDFGTTYSTGTHTILGLQGGLGITGVTGGGTATRADAWVANVIATGSSTITTANGLTVGVAVDGTSTMTDYNGIKFDVSSGFNAATNTYAFNLSNAAFMSNSRAITAYDDVADAARYVPLSTTDEGIVYDSQDVKIGTSTSGDVTLESADDIILSSSNNYIIVGDGTDDPTITSNGDYELILETNAGTNSGEIYIESGVAGDIGIEAQGNVIIKSVGSGQVQIDDTTTYTLGANDSIDINASTTTHTNDVFNITHSTGTANKYTFDSSLILTADVDGVVYNRVRIESNAAGGALGNTVYGDYFQLAKDDNDSNMNLVGNHVEGINNGGTATYVAYQGGANLTSLIKSSSGDLNFTAYAPDVDLYDNQADAWSFDTTGLTGLLKFITTDGSEGVESSGYIKGADFYSGDGTQGMSGTCNDGTNLTIKDGLVTGCS